MPENGCTTSQTILVRYEAVGHDGGLKEGSGAPAGAAPKEGTILALFNECH